MEPLLGPVDLTSIDVFGGDAVIFPLKGTTNCVNDEGEPADDVPALDWVIVGGESGPGARPMHPNWARSLRDQCQAADVPFLFKQWGEWIAPSQHGAARAENGFAPIKEFAMVEGQGRYHPPGVFPPGKSVQKCEAGQPGECRGHYLPP